MSEEEDEVVEAGSVVEHRFTCPYCWQHVSMLFDLSVTEQEYVEDCEVCCNPIGLRFRARSGMVVQLETRRIE